MRKFTIVATKRACCWLYQCVTQRSAASLTTTNRMIQKKVIDAIYKKFKRRPDSPDELDIPLLFEKLPENASVEIDGDELVLTMVDYSSPFRRIPISHIHAIIDFDEVVAIVLHSSIVFISKEDGAVSVHLKEIGLSLLDRVRAAFSGEAPEKG